MIAKLLLVATTATGALAQNTTYAGVSIPGFDFGTQHNGTQTLNGAVPPVAALGGPDGIGQMQHFVADRSLNIFRLPTGWQYLTNWSSDATALNAKMMSNYDMLVQGCINTGARCIIDLHNYARYNNAIIGQGGITNDQFASVWSQLATKWNSPQIVYGVMNEPHNLDINLWARTVQAAVTAIRKVTGNNNNIILLPGTGYDNAGGFVANGSFDALKNVTNPDNSTTNLVFEIHQYLDADASGTSQNCTTDNVAGLNNTRRAVASLNRQALLTETGGGSNNTNCLKYVCSELAYMNQNSATFLGYLGWAAGSFSTAYNLSLTPTNISGGWTDQPLLKQCFARK